jgi:hypothetical protein
MLTYGKTNLGLVGATKPVAANRQPPDASSGGMCEATIALQQ